MNTKAILFMMIAALGVIAVVLVTRSFLTQATTAQATAQPVVVKSDVKILVATRDLTVGTILKAEDFTERTWPNEGVNAAYFKSTSEGQNAIGHVVRYAIANGEPLTKTSLVAQGARGFLAAALTPGMRATTVQVSPTSGVGGFIFAGDRVDVILTHEINDDRQVAETVLQNVRVLGIDQRSTKDDQAARLAKTVTLEVTPKMAEKIAILPSLGSLTLALRSLASDETDADADLSAPPLDLAATHTWGAEVSGLLENPDALGAGSQVRVSRGNDVSVVDISNKTREEGAR